MKRIASIIIILIVFFLIVGGLVYLFIQQQTTLSPTGQSVMIGIGWSAYSIPFTGIDLYYPARLTIGNKIKTNAPQLFYIWLPMGGIYGFPNQ